jgi:CRISPR-associated protein Csx10
VSPHAARLVVRAARFPPRLRRHLAAQPKLREALSFIKPGVKVDRTTGQALDDHLRFEEVVRSGAVLEAPFALQALDDEQERVAQALLWAGAQTVERLGGKRRRGLGRCRFSVSRLTSDEALELLDTAEPLPAPQSARSLSRRFSPVESGAGQDDWVRIPLRLELLSPVVIPEKTVGNVVYSLDYIPGSYLLGAISQRLDPVGEWWFPYVARADLQCSHAYPEIDGQRGLPVPLGLFHDKEAGGLDKREKVWNRLAEGVDEGMDEAQAAQLKQHRNGYVGAFADKELPALVNPDLQLTTHSTIEDERQRPTEAVGGVFTYQALKAGVCLRAELRLRKTVEALLERDQPDWRTTLNGEIDLGRAKKDDYGRVSLQVLDDDPATGPYVGQGESGQLVLWLLSDLLLRDERLRPSTSVEDLQACLEAALKVKLRVEARTSQTLAALLHTRRTEGWHLGWGLHRPSYLGLAAGSCIRFTVEHGTVSQADLKRLAAVGLGERRAEGFGEVAFDPLLVTRQLLRCTYRNQPAQDDNQDKGNVLSPLSAQEADYDFARTLETVTAREAIRRAAIAFAANVQQRRHQLGWTENKPPNSQLGTLRTVLMRLKTGWNSENVQTWLSHLRNTQNRREKWEEAGLKAIERLLTDPDQVWQQLGLLEEGRLSCPVITQGAQDHLRATLWADAVRNLFAAAIRAEQRVRE